MGDIAMVNSDAHQYRASKYAQQNLTVLAAELEQSAMISGGFNALSQ